MADIMEIMRLAGNYRTTFLHRQAGEVQLLLGLLLRGARVGRSAG